MKYYKLKDAYGEYSYVIERGGVVFLYMITAEVEDSEIGFDEVLMRNELDELLSLDDLLSSDYLSAEEITKIQCDKELLKYLMSGLEYERMRLSDMINILERELTGLE